MTIRRRCSALRIPRAKPPYVRVVALPWAPHCARFFQRGVVGTIMVTRVRELRRKAALCRRAAAVPTSGSGNADRILVTLAERLERDAVLLEGAPEPTGRAGSRFRLSGPTEC